MPATCARSCVRACVRAHARARVCSLAATHFPSNQVVLAVHRKNCDPLVFGPELAIDSTPEWALHSAQHTTFRIQQEWAVDRYVPECATGAPSQPTPHVPPAGAQLGASAAHARTASVGVSPGISTVLRLSVPLLRLPVPLLQLSGPLVRL